jgi:hypothetical protein
MSRNIALIQDGQVVNIIWADNADLVLEHPDHQDGHFSIDFTDYAEDNKAQFGGTYDEKTDKFSQAPVAIAPLAEQTLKEVYGE